MRIFAFFGIFGVMATIEYFFPCRTLQHSKWLRWRNHFVMSFISVGLVRFVFSGSAVGIAVLAQNVGWGLFNVFKIFPWLEIFISLLVLDLVIYGQHILFHYNSWLWRLHQVHHADPDVDVTTGFRFHPLEILLSMAIKAVVIVFVGVSPMATLLFEIILNGMALFNHANIRLPKSLDRYMRLWVVTPDMHRVHHSVEPVETNSNFGFNLSLWDRLFQTYKERPAKGHLNMEIGLRAWPSELDNIRLIGLLTLPFRSKSSRI